MGQGVKPGRNYHGKNPQKKKKIAFFREGTYHSTIGSIFDEFRKMADKQHRVVILGAGPSGLSIAWGFSGSESIKFTVLEAGSRVGGLSRTIEHDGVRLDIGPHRLSPQIPGIVDKIKGLLGDDLLAKENLHGVFFNERLYSYPPKASDFLNLNSCVCSLRFGASWAAARALDKLSVLRGREALTFDKALLSHFGASFCRDVIFPMIEKVWGTKELHAEFARIRFELPTFRKIARKVLSGKYRFNDSVFYYPRHGFSQIWDTLQERLKTGRNAIETGASLDAIKCETLDGPFEVSFIKDGRKESITADRLVSTISNRTLLERLSVARLPFPFPVSPGDFQSRTMILGVLVIEGFTLPSRVVIFPEPTYIFNRISEMNQFSDLGYPKGHSVLMIDVICDKSGRHATIDEASFNAELTESFLSLGWCKREAIKKAFSLKFPDAYPILSCERYAAQERLEDFLAGTGVVLCGREASSDYNNAHNAIGKGFLAARHIMGEIGFNEYRRSSRTVGRLPIQD